MLDKIIRSARGNSFPVINKNLFDNFFKEFFDDRAKECRDDLYPTVTIRQLMWALKMKPIKRERWETCFDRKDI